jgi:hypothetical protein
MRAPPLNPQTRIGHGTTRAHSQTLFIESRQQQQEKQAAAKQEYEDRLTPFPRPQPTGAFHPISQQRKA